MQSRFWPAFALVAVVVSLAASCGSKGNSTGPSSGNSSSSQANAAQVSIPHTDGYGASTFTPGSVTIPVNGIVTWKNNDQQDHAPAADDNSWNSGDVPAGGEFSHQFSTAGTYTYHCTIHPGMTGSITVH